MVDRGGGYESFVAGIFSGITKLAVGHPFDTVKVRLQTNSALKGPLDCLLQTVRKEGVSGLYKGASPPLVGWMIMDSLMFGAITNYRQALKTHVWPEHPVLPFTGKIMSAVAAGWTVSLIAAPIEHVKALLQVQYGDRSTRKYTGPIDCAHKLLRENGVRGLWKGLFAAMLVGTSFATWWGTYEIVKAQLQTRTNLSDVSVNFWAGGCGASVFWITAYPFDIVKQQIFVDSVSNPKYPTWMSAARAVYARGGWWAFTRGFLPAFLRSFPANASAFATFETCMHFLKSP